MTLKEYAKLRNSCKISLKIGVPYPQKIEWHIIETSDHRRIGIHILDIEQLAFNKQYEDFFIVENFTIHDIENLKGHQ